MSRGFALEDEQVKEVLRLIDTNRYSQKEIADRFGISQGTVSRYNRIARLKFRVEDNARIIAKQNIEIISLKEKLNMSTREDKKTPTSFKKAAIYLRSSSKLEELITSNKDNTGYELVEIDGLAYFKVEGFISSKRDEAVQYQYRHPEYTLYTIRKEEILKSNNKGRVTHRVKMELRSCCSKLVYKEFISRVNIGYIGSFQGIEVLKVEK